MSKILAISSLEMSWDRDCTCIFELYRLHWICLPWMSIFFLNQLITWGPETIGTSTFFSFIEKYSPFNFLIYKHPPNSFPAHYFLYTIGECVRVLPCLLQAENPTVLNLSHTETSSPGSVFVLQLSWFPLDYLWIWYSIFTPLLSRLEAKI